MGRKRQETGTNGSEAEITLKYLVAKARSSPSQAVTPESDPLPHSRFPGSPLRFRFQNFLHSSHFGDAQFLHTIRRLFTLNYYSNLLQA